MRILRELRSKLIERKIEAQADFYRRSLDNEEVRQWQLRRFNRLWPDFRRHVPIYTHLASNHSVPEKFESWAHATESLPTTTRQDLQTDLSPRMDHRRGPDYYRSTGGSTAEPVSIPFWRSERSIYRANCWLGRSWYGIRPADRLALLWGLSHAMGSGWKGWLNTQVRRIKDAVLGYHRFSAYDLSSARLRKVAARMVEVEPDWVLGYAGVLDQLARSVRSSAVSCDSLKLKAVIATAEAFPAEESEDLLGAVFKAPVAMEYGTVETGPLAHTVPTGAFRPFAHAYHFEGGPARGSTNAVSLRVTSLFPRALPLVRYEVGDLIVPGAEGLNLSFEGVVGRDSESVRIEEEREIHIELFSHALRDSNTIRSFQIVERWPDPVLIRYTAPRELAVKEAQAIRGRLKTVADSLADAEFERVGDLSRTSVGKMQRVVRESSD